MDERVMLQGSPEWHEWRKSGIGASEIAAVMGLCTYGNTPYSTWLVKTGRAKGFAGNSFTEHGQETEGKARARYELKTMSDMPPACATHPKFKMCLASLDGWNEEQRKVLEIKCPKGRSVIDAALSGHVAPLYIPQVQYQMGVTGADALDFFVYHTELGLEALVEVKPDLEYQGRLFAGAEHFWNTYVLTDTPPPLTLDDAKVVDDPLCLQLCYDIELGCDTLSKAQLDFMKERVVRMAQHPKVRCGNVQISTVNRKGVFSYYKLTILNKTEQQVGA